MEDVCVTGFNHELFLRKCLPTGDEYDSTLCDFEILSSLLFRSGNIWVNRNVLHRAIKSVSRLHGWTLMIDRRSMKCNREGVTRHRSSSHKKYVHGSLKIRCPWEIKLKALAKTAVSRKNSNKKDYKPNWDLPVEIESANTNHTCTPGLTNLIITSQRSGNYHQHIPTETIFAMCHQIESGRLLTSSSIRNFLRPHWPRQKEITKFNVFSVRRAVMNLLPAYAKSNGDYANFKESLGSTELLQGLDHQPDLNDDEAYDLAKTVWMEVSATTKTKEEALFSFVQYLDLIQHRARGFSYKIASVDGDHSVTCLSPAVAKKKLLGVVWMTGTMRRNLELFGHYLCMDMMMRGINTLLWPYTAIALMDEFGELCIGCEGVVCGETIDMYGFVCSFIRESCPNLIFEDVKFVSADQFLSQEDIVAFGFTNAHFVMDHWHLREKGLKDRFGSTGEELLKGHLHKMLSSFTEEEFDSIVNSARGLLMAQVPRDGALESKFETFVQLKEHYAPFHIHSIPGHRGRRGSVFSEINHMSTLTYLNDGDRSSNKYCEHPITLIRDLLHRQQRHTRQKNQKLFGWKQSMEIEVANLQASPDTSLRDDLLLASRSLNFKVYESYKRFQLRALRDLERREVTNNESGDMEVHILSKRNVDAPPRIFRSPSQRCSCAERVSEDVQCAHEICLHNGFVKSLHLPRHFARERVTASLAGWVPAPPTCIDGHIGYEGEEIAIMSVDDGIGGMTGCADEHNMSIEGDRPALSNMPVNPDPGFLPETQATMQSLSKKKITNVFDAVLKGYPRFSSQKKKQIAMLVLQLEREIISKDGTMTSDSTGALSLYVPSGRAHVSEPRNRLKSSLELSRSIRPSKQIQNEGLSVTVTHGNMILEANANVAKKSKCGFCGSNEHIINTCSKKKLLKMNAMEYVLGLGSPAESQLRERMKTTVMINPDAGKGSALLSIDPDLLRRNFVIEEVSMTTACRRNDIEHMLFNVRFVDETGTCGDSKWLCGSLFNSLITHTKVKKKYVFDKTIHHKDNWITLGVWHDKNSEMIGQMMTQE